MDEAGTPAALRRAVLTGDDPDRVLRDIAAGADAQRPRMTILDPGLWNSLPGPRC